MYKELNTQKEISFVYYCISKIFFPEKNPVFNFSMKALPTNFGEFLIFDIKYREFL